MPSTLNVATLNTKRRKTKCFAKRVINVREANFKNSYPGRGDFARTSFSMSNLQGFMRGKRSKKPIDYFFHDLLNGREKK
jgi:hypothetical protein